MSKHDKQVRRERKKTDRARRLMARFRHPLSSPPGGSHIPHGAAAALAAAAVIAAGTQAYADPVRYDNPAHGDPGHYHWTSSAGQDALDVRLDSASQPGVEGLAGVFMRTSEDYGEALRRGGDLTDRIQALYDDTGSYAYFLVGVDAGEIIPTPGKLLQHAAYINSTYPYGVYTMLPEGTPTYLGVRFDPGDGDHWGWIGVVRTGAEIDPFAWGYETEVGVPIPAGAIPEPGSLALLAFGACAVLRKRRPA